MTNFNDVKKFMETFGQEVKKKAGFDFTSCPNVSINFFTLVKFVIKSP